MFCNFLSKVLIALAAVGMLSTGAMASQTIHFSQNFADNSIAPEVGDMALFAGNGFSLQTQQAWRNPAASYYGPSGTVAFNPPTGYGAGGAPPAGNGGGLGFGGIIGATTVNTAPGAGGPVQLAPGNVWVVDMKYISDMAPDDDAPGFIQGAPGFSAEVADFVTFGDDGFAARSSANSGGTTVMNAVYSNGADFTTEPSNLPVGHSAALATALNSELRTKFVYQPAPGRTGSAPNASNPTGLSTRASAQTLNSSGTSLGTQSHLDGNTLAGNFRTDYSAGLMIQMLNNHGTGNVTYASGVTGLSGASAAGVNVAYNDAENAGNLELGLTSLVFKQVRQADFNTDGSVTAGTDGGTLIANLGGTGKSFFQGDASGDGQVTAGADGGLLIGQLGTDILGAGQARADYYPLTGEIKISSNGSAQIDIISVANALIPGAAVPLGSVPGAVFQDPPSTGEINYQAFSPLGVSGILDSFSIGAILAPGMGPGGGLLPLSVAQFHWAIPGGGEFFDPVHIVPEPSSFVLAGLAGVAMVVAARRRRKVA